MSILPDYITIGQLFGRNYIFRVPRYQRGYAWEDAETDDFLNDITACYNARINNKQREHFFGGIVAVKREVAGSAGHHCDLIDGQQRVATFVMLASCMIKHLDHITKDAHKKGEKDRGDLAQSRSKILRQQYLEFNDEINRKPETISRLELSKPDQPYFSKLINHQDLPPYPSNAERESHIRLWRAYEKLYNKLSDIVAQHDSFDKQLDALALVRDVLLSDMSVINIVTDQRAEAYRLFQVLNNRGTKLTEGDLLRASTLELLGTPALTAEHDSAALMWDNILKYDPTYTHNFLGWHFASTQGKRASQSSLYDEFFNAFFPQNEHAPISKTAGREVVKAVTAIENGNVICRKLMEGEWPYQNGKSKRWEIDRLQLLVNNLKHTACFPLLIAASHLDESKFYEIVELTERFAFRYKSVCNQHIGSLQNVYHEHALKIRNDIKNYKVSSLRTAFRKLQDEKATDALFSTSLSQALAYQQSTGNKLLKYLLSTLENYWRWYEEGAQGQPKCRDNTRVFDLASMTIEHLYPQKSKTKDHQPALDPLLHKLGNLTLLGELDNDAVGNKSFDEKKSILAKSALRINQIIAKETAWTAKEIEKRERELIKAALKVFSM